MAFRQAPSQKRVRHTHPRSVITVIRSYDGGETWDVENAAQLAAGGGQEFAPIHLGRGQVGGLLALTQRTAANLAEVAAWVADADWVEFLARDPAARSPTSICLRITEPWFTGMTENEQRAVTGRATEMLAVEAVAYDITAHRDAPPGFRIWGGATVETADTRALLPWLDWAWHVTAEEKGPP